MDQEFTRKYHAAVLIEPKTIELQEMSPATLGSADALVRVHAAGVCGTDLAIHDGHYPVPLPLVLGHEWVGTVEAVGTRKDGNLVGRRMVGEINNHCVALRLPHLCAACERGLVTHCQKRSVTGIVSHNGAFGQYLVCPTDNLRFVPDDMTNEAAVLLEPLAAALQTFEMTLLNGTEAVAVLGCGRLGVLVAVVAGALGARVLTATRRTEDVATASRLGVEAKSFESNERIVEWVRGSTDGLGADVVVEATGSPAGLGLALNCVRPRGVVALKSTPGKPVEQFDLTRAVVDEIRLQGSRCGDFKVAVRFWEQHRPPLEKLIAAEFPLAQIRDAIERARQPGKVLVRCAE